MAWLHLTGDPLADAHAYFDAANRLNHGLPLYPPGIDPSSNLVYLYPTLLAVALRPLCPVALLAVRGRVGSDGPFAPAGVLIVQLGALNDASAASR